MIFFPHASLRRVFTIVVVLSALVVAGPVPAQTPRPIDPTIAADREVEPVILSGSQFPLWSAGPEVAVREPQVANDPLNLQSDCEAEYADGKDHNCYQDARVHVTGVKDGVALDRLIGYRWDSDSGSFVEIPLQVDERFTRYLTNNNSGFAFYSGADKHTTYAFDREGWRFTTHSSEQPCLAQPRNGIATTPDPIAGLDDNDELVFMFNDSGDAAPSGAANPAGITELQRIQIADPSTGSVRFAYIGLASSSGPQPSFNESNGYVSYVRDADADTYLYSQSSYGNYGATVQGPYFDPATGTCITSPVKQRRPKDSAWIITDRYKFRYEGRWVMNNLQVSSDNGQTYGPDLIDQWKARAFQQRPGGQTPCCGYEEEVNNWGGSSILLGELSGPVRTIRETWGADSATNNIRREVFYRYDIRQQNYLRVHVIPPADGIYVQWDYNAGKVDRYYNPYVPEGVAIDGHNDEVFGNLYAHAGGDGLEIRDDDPVPVVGPVHVEDGDPKDDGSCDFLGEDCIYNDFDIHDPTFSGPHGALNWEQISGPSGTLVTRWTKWEVNAGNGYQATTFPYYRDDSCFDDGTGQDPGPHLNSRNVDDGVFATWTDPSTGEVKDRECWDPGEPLTGDPTLDRRYWQGDIGTHGLHLHLIADSDNAMLTEPITELTSEYRIVVVPGNPGNVGEQYGRSVDYPLIASVG